MKPKNFALVLTLFLLVFVSASSMPTLAFSQNPQLTDATADTPTNYEDLTNIWIDHNTTHLMFKVDLAATFNGTFLGQVVYMGISVNASTEIVTGFWGTWESHFLFGVSGNGGSFNVVLYDITNSSNDLWSNNHLGYYIQSNGNKTLEVGYRLKTTQNGKGFLNVSQGQSITVRFYSGGDSDVAPENLALPLSYTLTMEEEADSDWIIILLIILIPVIGVALGLFILSRRKPEL